MLAGTPPRYVAETLGIAESLLGKAVATICRLRRITWIAGSPRIAPTGIGSRT
jgi:hypothetical protein